MNRRTLQNVVLLGLISPAIAIIIYVLNLWLLSSNPTISPRTATFFEGILAVLSGLLLLLGSGGISRNTRSAAMIASAAKGISNGDIIGPSEIFERDAWKPKGFARLGLILVMAGIFLLVIYFVSSYVVR
jgi:hypothetical protein